MRRDPHDDDLYFSASCRYVVPVRTAAVTFEMYMMNAYLFSI